MTYPEPAATVTLLTDFGLDDPFVGIMKGVMLREAPALRFVDITHEVPPQDVALAELWLDASYRWFPAGSVHLCVVDPGVGTARAALVAIAAGHYFVAPDNGVLSGVLRGAGGEVRHVDVARLGLHPRSRTFHGRDIFAPVAALLASGKVAFDALGPRCEPLLAAEQPPIRGEEALLGRVVAVDHFGNLITNLPGAWISAGFVRVEVGSRTLRMVSTYAEAEIGECVALISSFDTLEVAVRNGHAARELDVARGASVRVLREDGRS
jgi:S-adenosylmethionine hydrolase